VLEIFLTIIHVVVCLFLIIVVLLQSGKAADLAGAFGGMGSQTAFGPRGAATMLSKATTFAAVVFMLTSIWLGIEAGRHRNAGDSVIERTGTGTAVPEVADPADRPQTKEERLQEVQQQLQENMVIQQEAVPAGGESEDPAGGEASAPKQE
jgi:preprotein translocase subunit SecG